MKKNKKNINKFLAFTLTELIIVLFVASIGVISSLSLAVRSSYFQNVKKDLLSVAFLSYEGLELMTNIRDTNLITDRDYDNWDSVSPLGIGQAEYLVDYYSLLASSTSGGIDSAFLQRDSNGFLLHNNSYQNSIFKRLISVQAESISSTTIESWIQWENRGKTYDYKLETILYDLSF